MFLSFNRHFLFVPVFECLVLDSNLSNRYSFLGPPHMGPKDTQILNL